MKNTTLILALITLSVTIFIVALHSIDNITARDCERGIQDACKYINN